MGTVIALICIFIILPLLFSTTESKNRWMKGFGNTFFGSIAAILSLIVAITFIVGIPMLGLGVIARLFPNSDIWEDILMPILGLISWVGIFVAFLLVKAWWEQRKEKRLNKSRSEISEKQTEEKNMNNN